MFTLFYVILVVIIFLNNMFLHVCCVHCCFHAQIDAGRPVEEVYESVKAIFAPKNEKVTCHSYAWMKCLVLLLM